MKRITKPLYLSIVYLFFYTPIAVLIAYSFNNSKYSLIWHGTTLNWYHELFHDTDLWIATLHSILLGISSATIATVIGTLAAFSQYRYQYFGKKLLYGLICIIILAPDIVMGIALLILFTVFKISLGYFSLLIAHITFSIPFVVITVYSRLKTLDKNMFKAAKDLGAGDWTILYRIAIPLIWPAILASWLLSFTLSIDDVIISYFVSGPDFEILPLRIYSMVRFGINPEINALCAILFIFTLFLVVAAQLVSRKKT